MKDVVLKSVCIIFRHIGPSITGKPMQTALKANTWIPNNYFFLRRLDISSVHVYKSLQRYHVYIWFETIELSYPLEDKVG